MIESTGIPSNELVHEAFPSIDRINRGPVAIIECYQSIPCNPCSTACNQKAMKIMSDINDIPSLNTDLCNGCGICISKCPGLAIMVVDGSYSEDEAIFKIPYEFLPLPKQGDVVKGLNRAGEYIADVKVIRVVNIESFDKTPVIHVAVNKDYLYEFRNIRLGDR
ncbi:4Fe-4S binding protein [Brassicibacter mesophilus]|uniref:4Fe-4S binding protein n=1 Tax=Brassicibacter mesophilus TaxID=745119 RepID=UPI003D207CAA